MIHNLSQNIKGTLGEEYVKREFAEFPLFTLPDILYSIEIPDRNSEEGKKLTYAIYMNGKHYKNGILHKDGKWHTYCYNKIVKKFGTFTFPDFWVRGTKIFMEVKTGKNARLERSQLEEFPKLLEREYRIFIVKPELTFNDGEYSIVDFNCSEFLGKNKRKKISSTDLRQLIQREVENFPY